MTRHDRRVIRRAVLELNARRLHDWWYSRGPWTHITVLTVLWLSFCGVVAYAAYPYLERMVTHA
jgi:hypothetical protein